MGKPKPSSTKPPRLPPTAREAAAGVRQRLKHLERLHEVSRRLSASLDQAELLREAVLGLEKHLGYGRAAVFLLDESDGSLRMASWVGYEPGALDSLVLAPGQGICGWAAARGQAVIVPDVRADRRYVPVSEAVRSELAVPIRLGERVLGVINVESEKPAAFGAEDLSTLTVVASQLAVAIENSRLHARTERALRETRALLRVSQSLTATREPQQVFADLMQAIVENIPAAQNAVLHLLEEDTLELVPRYTSDRGTEVRRETRLRVGRGLAGRAVEEGRTVYSQDVTRDPDFVAHDADGHIRSLLAAPLVVEGKAIGVISVTSAQAQAFGQEDHDFLGAAAAQAGLAILDARLHREARQRARMLAGLMETIAYLNRERDLDRLLQRLVQRAAETFSAAAAAIMLVGQEREELVIAAAYGLSRAYVQGQRIPLSRAGPLLEVLRGHGYFYLSDARENPLGDPDLIRREKITSILALPLIREERWIGSLNIYAKQRVREFDPDEVELARSFANQAMIALDSAELIAELEKARAGLSRLNAELEAKVAERSAALEEAQDRLLKAERLAAMGQFGAGIAHELRNPLAIMSNSLYYLQKHLEQSSPKLRQHLVVLQRELRRSEQIIEDLLAFARARAPRVEPVELGLVMRHSLEQCPAPDSVTVKLDLGELDPVAADANQMQQVFVNLIENAYQAMPQGGQLELSCKPWEGGALAVIADSGVGISQRNLARIFEPLFTTKSRGAGLGLAIAKHLVEAHRGRIEVHSEQGKGTRFSIWLPAWSPEAAAPEPGDGDG